MGGGGCGCGGGGGGGGGVGVGGGGGGGGGIAAATAAAVMAVVVVVVVVVAGGGGAAAGGCGLFFVVLPELCTRPPMLTWCLSPDRTPNLTCSRTRGLLRLLPRQMAKARQAQSTGMGSESSTYIKTYVCAYIYIYTHTHTYISHILCRDTARRTHNNSSECVRPIV